MKRAKLNNDKITALYCRLSKDDGTNNESMSIMEVLTLLLVIFAALSYIDNHKKK